MMLRTARRTLLLYSPKFGSSPEARKAINPRPVTPGPCCPPVQSPFSVCVFTRYCRPLSYSSRTSRGTPSPIRAFGGWALAPARLPNRTSPTASVRDMDRLLSGHRPRASLLQGRRPRLAGSVGLIVFVRDHAGFSQLRLHRLVLSQLLPQCVPLPVVEQHLQLLLRKPAEVNQDAVTVVRVRPPRRLHFVRQQGDEPPPLHVIPAHAAFEQQDRRFDGGAVTSRTALPSHRVVSRELLVGQGVGQRFVQQRILVEQAVDLQGLPQPAEILLNHHQVLLIELQYLRFLPGRLVAVEEALDIAPP